MSDNGHEDSRNFAYMYLATVSPTSRLRARQVKSPRCCHYWQSQMLVRLVEEIQFIGIRKVRYTEENQT